MGKKWKHRYLQVGAVHLTASWATWKKREGEGFDALEPHQAQ